MRGDLEKREGPAPFRSAALAFLLIGGLLLLMLVSGWLYAGLSGAVITTVLGAIALMLVHKVSPQFFLLLGGARSIDPEDMPALFDIIAVLCRRAGITQIPSLYFLPSGVPTAFATGVGLLSYAARRHANEAEKSEGLSLRETFVRVRKWFKDLF